MYDKITRKDITPLVIFPNSYEDLDKIIKMLETGHNVIINVHNLNDKMKYRILDFLTGFAYAKEIKKEKLDNWIYLFSF